MLFIFSYKTIGEKEDTIYFLDYKSKQHIASFFPNKIYRKQFQ